MYTNYNGTKFNNLRNKERSYNFNKLDEDWSERDSLPESDPIGDIISQDAIDSLNYYFLHALKDHKFIRPFKCDCGGEIAKTTHANWCEIKK